MRGTKEYELIKNLYITNINSHKIKGDIQKLISILRNMFISTDTKHKSEYHTKNFHNFLEITNGSSFINFNTIIDELTKTQTLDSF